MEIKDIIKKIKSKRNWRLMAERNMLYSKFLHLNVNDIPYFSIDYVKKLIINNAK